ncbi:hypothetical protein BUALT_Bualt12G0073500 [Buddleja alternifolia]|uniref:Uncharacterized protein n=1 Tax=Buddleja alternifolia TaxID=168488 RepID=A0AAV6WPS7_9LAMI|nr:hypothetical protein BUALT_Bualt12G0073500 [Buddleja alternifolia]
MAKVKSCFVIASLVLAILVMVSESRVARKDLGVDLGGVGVGVGAGKRARLQDHMLDHELGPVQAVQVQKRARLQGPEQGLELDQTATTAEGSAWPGIEN